VTLGRSAHAARGLAPEKGFKNPRGLATDAAVAPGRETRRRAALRPGGTRKTRGPSRGPGLPPPAALRYSSALRSSTSLLR
jgi:hypothetical protein